jgi:hypothetical protein
MRFRNKITIAVLLLSVFCYSGTAGAWAFYWSKTDVQTSSWQKCMAFVYSAAQKTHLSQLKETNLAVTGTRNGASASVTCVGTGASTRAIAVVMVVGDLDAPVRQLRDELVNEVHRAMLYDY